MFCLKHFSGKNNFWNYFRFPADSGFLCISEFKEFIKSMNYDMNKVVILYGYLDKNQDNKINFEEFCNFLAEFESE